MRIGPGPARAALSALALLAFVLPACTVKPVYSQGENGLSAEMFAAVEVAPIPERAGYLVRDRLVAQLNTGQPEVPKRYRLEVTLDDRIDAFGVRENNTAVRERRTLRARYKLVAIDSGAVLFQGNAGSDAGIDVVGSEYAVVAAEVTALENLAATVAAQIVGRLAIYARNLD
jgi:LPS-assembly lipoprotein